MAEKQKLWVRIIYLVYSILSIVFCVYGFIADRQSASFYIVPFLIVLIYLAYGLNILRTNIYTHISFFSFIIITPVTLSFFLIPKDSLDSLINLGYIYPWLALIATFSLLFYNCFIISLIISVREKFK